MTFLFWILIKMEGLNFYSDLNELRNKVRRVRARARARADLALVRLFKSWKFLIHQEMFHRD
jgi:hypothetical protein